MCCKNGRDSVEQKRGLALKALFTSRQREGWRHKVEEDESHMLLNITCSSLKFTMRKRCPPESVMEWASNREACMEMAFMVHLEGQTDFEQDSRVQEKSTPGP